jgi:hypothetical protein
LEREAGRVKSFASLVKKTRQRFAGLTNARKGKNTKYSMEDFGTSAFSVFFTQAPSFLAYQKTMQQNKGRSNAQSLFQIEEIPCDNQTRETLDHVAPEEIFPLYDEVLESFKEQGVLEQYRGLKGTIAIALDGTWYHSSEKITCPNCSCIEHVNGKKTCYHSAITPVIVAPANPHAIPLRPEFIVPQDGHKKQDCEIAAAKRWLEKNSQRYCSLNVTLLGDDIYAHQPTCRRAQLYGFHFLFVCKPDSHTTLYDWVNLLQPGSGLHVLKQRVKNKKNQWEEHTYRFANCVPLAEGDDALKVNWCEVTITNKKGEVLYRNGFITDHQITPENVASIVTTARARWKIENENNNVLKTKGYHLEHNFGHGQKHLSSLLAAMNILAFLYHSFLHFCDEKYRLIRSALPTRQTFFDDLRALTRYLLFADWDALMDFMMRGLEIGPYASPT